MNAKLKCVLVGFALCAPLPASSAESEQWTYEKGSEDWSFLDAGNALCGGGLQQSPIDVVRENAVARPLPPLKFEYSQSVDLAVLALPNTIQASPRQGDANALRIGDEPYILKQFHFHTPSENFIDGEQYPLEMHLVHRAENGHLAVAAILFDEGTANPELAKILAVVPSDEGESADLDAFDLASFVPSSEVYRFAGSLTTPPCAEQVAWHVVSEHKTASIEQISALAQRFSGKEFPSGNRRPVQPLHGRKVYVGN